MARQILVGLNEICQYAAMSEGLVLRLIRSAKFLARKTGDDDSGTWISSTESINQWAMSFANSGINLNSKLKDGDEPG